MRGPTSKEDWAADVSILPFLLSILCWLRKESWGDERAEGNVSDGETGSAEEFEEDEELILILG